MQLHEEHVQAISAPIFLVYFAQANLQFSPGCGVHGRGIGRFVDSAYQPCKIPAFHPGGRHAGQGHGSHQDDQATRTTSNTADGIGLPLGFRV